MRKLELACPFVYMFQGLLSLCKKLIKEYMVLYNRNEKESRVCMFA